MALLGNQADTEKTNINLKIWRSHSTPQKLSDIFSHELHVCFKKPQSDDRWKWFDTVAGLGYTAILTHSQGLLHDVYKKCFEAYLCVRKNYGEKSSADEMIKILSRNLAEIVCGAFFAFNQLSYPRYFYDFREALERIFVNAKDGGETKILNKIDEVLKIVNTQSPKNG